MEIFAFFALILAGAAALVWRSPRGTSSGPASMVAGVPDDLRDKHSGDMGGSGGGF
jgi:hypothetical protein